MELHEFAETMCKPAYRHVMCAEFKDLLKQKRRSQLALREKVVRELNDEHLERSLGVYEAGSRLGYRYTQAQALSHTDALSKPQAKSKSRKRTDAADEATGSARAKNNNKNATVKGDLSAVGEVQAQSEELRLQRFNFWVLGVDDDDEEKNKNLGKDEDRDVDLEQLGEREFFERMAAKYGRK